MIVDYEDEEYIYELNAVSLENYEMRPKCIDRLMSNNYTEFKISTISRDTIGFGIVNSIFTKFTIEFNNRKYLIKFLEPNSRFRFSTMHCGRGEIFFVFYDSFDREFFEKAKSFIHDIKQRNNNPIILLIRNSYDLNIETNQNFITEEEALEFACENNIFFFHISSFKKDESGIKEILEFTLNAMEYLKNLKEKKPKKLRKICNVKKPIIYLYPKKPIDISIQINMKNSNINKFTVVYPKFNKENNTWNVHAKPNGDIIINDRTYPYLFWEAQSYVTDEINEGFIVKDEDSEKFLEEKLKILGLNDKESTDFITFWLPILLANKLSVCTFQSKEYYENFELKIEPKPDSLIRIFLAIKKLKAPINIKEQKLEKIERKGYTVVEWGGSNY
jgi:hypothetical protein